MSSDFIVAKKEFIKVGETTIPAPIGVEIDPKTGDLLVPVESKPVGDPVLTPIIKKNLLINEGFIKLKLLFKLQNSAHCPDAKGGLIKEVVVPIQSVQKLDNIRPGDEVKEQSKIKAITIVGIPADTSSKIAGQKANLIVKVVLKVKLIVYRKKNTASSAQ
ncbi:hypothetical protein [Desulfofalx alkaliphila]|uniref:hypothetical protein n=1 Tax=Desulfofalx alkaliphila TaxID=105483 RepID=UPI0004E1D127|nr:hypothetical protein [Desulfofalx alkaliphila]